MDTRCIEASQRNSANIVIRCVLELENELNAFSIRPRWGAYSASADHLGIYSLIKRLTSNFPTVASSE